MMRGVEGFFSRPKLVEGDDLARLEQVWISPSIPRWAYTPIAPYRLVHINPEGGQLLGMETYTALA
jgi:hypothetical protein